MDKKINARKKAQRLARQRKMRNRRIALTICLMIAVCLVSVGGTLAWITATTTPVTNTFTVGDITITLDEGDVYEKGEDGTTPENLGKFRNNANRVQANQYQAIPGNVYDKDPTVTVKANSEECYLFVKFEETGNPSTYYSYTSKLNSINGWTQGDGTDIPNNVWYRTVSSSTSDQEFELLDGNKITVKSTDVTKESMSSAAAASLKWTAYACQTANMSGDTDEAKVVAAWNIVKPATNA